jgi:hypothetical protein
MTVITVKPIATIQREHMAMPDVCSSDLFSKGGTDSEITLSGGNAIIDSHVIAYGGGAGSSTTADIPNPSHPANNQSIGIIFIALQAQDSVAIVAAGGVQIGAATNNLFYVLGARTDTSTGSYPSAPTVQNQFQHTIIAQFRIAASGAGTNTVTECNDKRTFLRFTPLPLTCIVNAAGAASDPFTTNFEGSAVPLATPIAGVGFVYVSEVAGRCELFYYDSSGAKVQLTSAGAMASAFNVDGDSGPAQPITAGNTLNILGGDGIATVASATDTVTVAIDDSVAQNIALSASGGGIAGTNPIVIDAHGTANTFGLVAGSNVTLTGGAGVVMIAAGSGGGVGGLPTQIQFNAAGVFDGDANLIWDDAVGQQHIEILKGMRHQHRAVAATGLVSPEDRFVIVNSAGAPVVLTLPQIHATTYGAAQVAVGHIVTIKSLVGPGPILIQPHVADGIEHSGSGLPPPAPSVLIAAGGGPATYDPGLTPLVSVSYLAVIDGVVGPVWICVGDHD